MPDGTTGIYAAKRELLYGAFEYAVTAVEHAPGVAPITRPAFSYWPHDPDLFLSFSEDLSGCVGGVETVPPSAFTLHTPDYAQNWSDAQVQPPNPPTSCDYRGRSPVIAVCNTGELVVAAGDVDIRRQGASDPVWLNNNGRPFVTWSDDNGASWTQDPVKVGDDFSGITAPQPGDTIAIDGGQLLPYIAIDRVANDYDKVYVLFAGREHPASGDLDLYLAWSNDDGATFPNNQILHLTDMMLLGIDALPEGPDQIPAGLATDSCGGVHILWYDTVATEDWLGEISVDVYWAIITDIGTPEQFIEVARLTSEEFPVGTMDDPVFLGERQTLATNHRGVEGLFGMACYSMVQDGVVDTVVQRVKTTQVCGDGPGGPLLGVDANVNGLIDPPDTAAYVDDWSLGWPAADLDEDGDVDADDFVIFVQQYDEHAIE